MLHSFLDAKHDLRDSKKRQELDKLSGHDLIQRARGLLRSKPSKEDEKKLRETLKGYSERRIMLSEFRKVVEGFEATYGQKGQS